MSEMTALEWLLLGMLLGSMAWLVVLGGLLAILAVRRRRPPLPEVEAISEATRTEWLRDRRV